MAAQQQQQLQQLLLAQGRPPRRCCCCSLSAAPSRPLPRRLQVAACAPAPPPPVLCEASIASGRLSIQRLQQDDIQGAGLLLTRAFAGSPEAVRLQEAMSFMQQHAGCDTDGITLVARLVPTDPSLLPPGKPSRLVGCVSLGFAGAAQGGAPGGPQGGPPPPPGQPYLSNMAVDPKFRRQGIARLMLQACDAEARTRGQLAIWLHVLQEDPPAQALYAGYGYAETARDAPARRGLFGMGGAAASGRPRILMQRQL